ncbi:MAG: type III pantothenate kinase [Planctomycetota bacterium]
MSDRGQRLVIDIGNTFIHWGRLGDGIVDHGRLPHDEAGRFASQVLKERGGTVVVASVNPRPLQALCQGLEEAGARVIELRYGVTWKPKVLVDTPAEVGIDRLVNARAVKESHPEGAIIVDHGTALTVDFIAPGGCYAGGVIVPGIQMAARVLSEKTALIPRVSTHRPHSVVGTNTSDCISAGLYYGMVGMVEAVVRRIRLEKGGDFPVLVTGGDASFIVEESTLPMVLDPLLTLRGLALAGDDAGLWS